MKSAIVLWLLAAAGVAHAAPLIDEPVAELRLKSGKVYRDAIAKSYTPTTVFVKHAEGASSIKYEDIPDELVAPVIAIRPAPPTAAELVASETRRKEALAREAARPKPAQKARAPSMPLNLSELGVSVGPLQGNIIPVEIHNFGPTDYVLGPHSLIATTSDGRKLTGQAWVGLDSTGRVSAILHDSQSISTREPKQLHVRFEVPAGATITSVDWAYPKQ